MSPSLNHHPYLKRHLEVALAEALADTPVVCILGPRQCGKSTLAQHAAPDRTYVSLDDPNSYQLASLDPKGFIGELPEVVTIDEIQRVPELTLAIKQSVDGEPRRIWSFAGIFHHPTTPHSGRTPTDPNASVALPG